MKFETGSGRWDGATYGIQGLVSLGTDVMDVLRPGEGVLNYNALVIILITDLMAWQFILFVEEHEEDKENCIKLFELCSQGTTRYN